MGTSICLRSQNEEGEGGDEYLHFHCKRTNQSVIAEFRLRYFLKFKFVVRPSVCGLLKRCDILAVDILSALPLLALFSEALLSFFPSLLHSLLSVIVVVVVVIPDNVVVVAVVTNKTKV